MILYRNYSNNTNNIQARVTKKFSKAIQSEKVALATQYGALAGLGELGPEAGLLYFFPFLCFLFSFFLQIHYRSYRNGSCLVYTSFFIVC